ncbi:Nuclease S1 [Colletotrichum sp. SAR11_240]|nr:Nuclease S1 [Colletotrichum sp. SAR11_240]
MRLSTALLACAVPSVFSWGNVGHRTVGYLAEKYLTDEAAALVGKLLANDRNYDISDAATWADTLRGHMGWASKYHYIIRQTAQILDTSLPLINRKNATMFVIHFLGDIHQPLHATGLLRGGNDIRPVCWRRQPSNGRCTGPVSLHSVWDTQIPHRIRGLAPHLSIPQEKAAAASWAADLFSRHAASGVNATSGQCVDLATGTCALGWATESNAFVCSHVLKPGLQWLKAHDLSEGYYDQTWEVVDEVIGRAGVRLGAWLNAVAAKLASETGPVFEEL